MSNPNQRRLGIFIVLVLICLGVGVLGSWATRPAIPGWYAGLAKPSWNPPNWIFGPVWTALYLMMAISAWLVVRARGLHEARGPLSLFFLQLILNGTWSFLFFGLKRPDLAFVEIILLWLAIGLAVSSFWFVRPLAGKLLLPYWAWVSFAAILNGAIWRLNL